MARAENFKLAPGHNTSLTGNTYLWTAFTVPADALVIGWVVPALATPPRPAELVLTLDGTVYPTGFYEWEWRFSYLSFGQWDYLIDTFWATGYSAPVSVQTYTDTDTAVIYNATLLRPLPFDGMEKAHGGYANVVLRFTNGVLVP